MSNLRAKLWWSRVIGFLIGLAFLGLPMAAAAQGGSNLQGNPPEKFREVLPFQTGTGATPIENLPDRFKSIAQIVATVFSIVIGISGAIFMVLLLVGGVQYMTAAGNEENTTKAKKLLVDAVIGLILTLSAWAIGTFVLRQFYGTSTGGSRGGGGAATTSGGTGASTQEQEQLGAAFRQGQTDGQKHKSDYSNGLPCDTNSPHYQGGSYTNPQVRSQYDAGFQAGCS